jgi:hypothetical protein
MKKQGVLTRCLTLAGTLLAWLPILAPVVFSLIALFQGRRLRFDYLMPAELFPIALAGGLLLFWAALRVRSHRRLIGGSLAAALAFLIGGQFIAVVTGLASGETEPVGWPWALVLTTLVAYILALVLIGIAGVLLLRDLFRPSRPTWESFQPGR